MTTAQYLAALKQWRMNMTLTIEHIEQVADIIINTRDFCGNEKEAAAEIIRELGYSGNDVIKLYRAANYLANARWNKFQVQAGVPAKYTW